MTHVTCRLTAKNGDNQVWPYFYHWLENEN